MKKLIALLLLIIVLSLSSQAQTLYMPRNVKAAFEKATRSMDGNPGPHYWQNRSNYEIDVTVAPPDRTIKGSEKIVYFNNSPDTLHTVVFRLTLNYHKPEAVRSDRSALDSTQLTSGIHINHFTVNGKPTAWPEVTGDYTWQNIRLQEPLFPGDSIYFSIQWHYKIAPAFMESQGYSREGIIDSTTWCVAYFYPQVAVYDDYNGWDILTFTGGQEFYNDFSNYTLRVHTPKNFIVWATGTLQNPDEVLQPHYAQLLKQSETSDEVVRIAEPSDLKRKNITRQNESNTWIWNARDVTEVVFFLSDHYNWDAASVVVDSATGRRASVQSAYNDSSAVFHQAVTFGQQVLTWLSTELPGVPYPYPKMTVTEGFGGMEYPMMANVGSFRTNNVLLAKAEMNHEIAHTYFPFYIGVNESRYAFMDEGWATTFHYLLSLSRENIDFQKDKDIRWTHSMLAWTNRDPSQESQIPLIEVNRLAGYYYGQNAYTKPLWAYMALKDLLGDALFKKCLQGYIERWHGKHPIPWDFFNAFNDISGKDLNWFWNSWFFSHGYNDLGIGKVTKTNSGYAVEINNVGGFAIPFTIKIKYNDGDTSSLHQTPLVWKQNRDQIIIDIKSNKEIRSLTIDNGLWMDANEEDNLWRAESKL